MCKLLINFKMGDQKVEVNFVCQRCLQPLKLDSSFGSIGEHTLAELSLPITVPPEINLESEAGSLDQYTPAFHLSDSSSATNGFTLVGKEGEPGISTNNMRSITHITQVRVELFTVLSGNSDVDHPLCEECTDTLLELLDQQLQMAENECDDYNKFLERLESQDQSTLPSVESLEQQLESLKAEEASLRADLNALKVQEQEALEALQVQEREQERLVAEEERYWREYSKSRRQLLQTEDEQRSMDCQLNYARTQLDKVQMTNVYNVTFHIWHNGHFGTINTFRLGRLPSAPVDWSEINAAWGQTVLLLSSLARKLDLTFSRYKLVPYGNHSYVEVLADQRELPLYGAGGFRFLWDTKFDQAMVAFLDCVQQFKEAVESREVGFTLPYKIPSPGKIEDVTTGNFFSVKIQFNSEEQWTKALKFMLTNLKWGLAWVSSQFAKDLDSDADTVTVS